ncbi:MAG: hypothetical protein Q9212_001528 [Teloschistes hypoglaucus]
MDFGTILRDYPPSTKSESSPIKHDHPSPKSGPPLMKSDWLSTVLERPSVESEYPSIKPEHPPIESEYPSRPNSSAETIHTAETRKFDLLLQPLSAETPDTRASTHFLGRDKLEDLLQEYSVFDRKLRGRIEDYESWIEELKGYEDPFYEPCIRGAEISLAKLKKDKVAVNEYLMVVQSRLDHCACGLDCDERWKYDGG